MTAVIPLPYPAMMLAVLAGSHLLCLQSSRAEDYQAELAAVKALGELTTPPAVFADDTLPGTAAKVTAGETKFIFFDALDYRGKPTRVHASIGIPSGASAAKPVPGIVLVHGGGGSAFPEWVEKWNARGYAAISIAVEGQLAEKDAEGKWKKHAMSGPHRAGIYSDSDVRPIADQWMYHAVADTVLANSLLRSLPEVAENKVGVMGVSWGGIITSTVMGIDPRFAFAIPTYGCGHLYDALSHYSKHLGKNSLYRKVWDPMIRLENASMPALWLTWPEDFHFPLDNQAYCYHAASGRRMVSIVPKMGHGHGAAWNRPESYDFAHGIVSRGRRWSRQRAVTLIDGKARFVLVSSRNIHSASLHYITGTGKTGDLPWTEIPIDSLVEKPPGVWNAAATLPEEATGWFINMKAKSANGDADVIVSSDYQEKISVSVNLPDQLAFEHSIGDDRSTGKINVSFTAPSNVEITGLEFDRATHPGAFGHGAGPMPWVLTNPATNPLAITFDNTVARLAAGQSSSATLVISWEDQLDGTLDNLRLPVRVVARENLITNGSFEDPVLGPALVHYSADDKPMKAAGWTLSTGGVTHIRDGVFSGIAAEGNQWLSLENNESNPAGEIIQTFATNPGTTYALSFKYAALAQKRTWTLNYEVGGAEGNVTVDTSALPMSTWSPWTSETFFFTAKDKRTTLTFKGEQINGFHGMAIDDVKVRPVDPHEHWVTSTGTLFEPKSFYPKFGWDSVPVYMMFGSHDRLLEPGEVKKISADSHMVCIEKQHGKRQLGGAELGLKHETGAFKKVSPDIKVLGYFNAAIAHPFTKYTRMLHEKTIDEAPEMREFLLTDSKTGELHVEEGNPFYFYKLVNPNMRKWWSDSAAALVKQAGADGIFVDQMHGMNWTYPKELRESVFNGLADMLQQLKDKMGPDKILLANNGAGLEKVFPIADAFMFEHYDPESMTKEHLLRDWQLMEKIADAGKICVNRFGANPEKGSPLAPYTSGQHRSRIKVEEYAELSKQQLPYHLALYLIGAQPYSYFQWGWGWGLTTGPLEDYPELQRPLGKPLEKYKRVHPDKWEFTRQFEHASVWVDTEKREAKIEWK